MKRDLQPLKHREFDVVIVGGGIFGAFAAWDATLRGLSVALVEREDFCSGVSANSYKIVHGGLRYLQHGDIIRLRASCHERSAMLRIAPHLVEPLPIVIPTYGRGKSSRAFLATGSFLYDLLTADRNRGIRDPNRKIPWTRLLSRKDILDQFPDLDEKGLTGGVVVYDGRFYNPTRLVLAVVKSAVEKGAVVANYIEATEFLKSSNRVIGIKARDALAAKDFEIRGKVVLNAAGPWAERLLETSLGLSQSKRSTYSRDACFVVSRRFPGPYTLAIQGRTRDPDALISRPARHLFLSPWRQYTLVGVWHKVTAEHPDQISVLEEELEAFLEEINWAYPSLRLTRKDVLMCNYGLVPFGENQPGAQNLSYGKRSHIVDHARLHNIDGLVTLIGVRYTMGRADAAKAMAIVANKLRRTGRPPLTDQIPVYGGNIENFEALVHDIMEKRLPEVNEPVARALAHNYGANVEEVLQFTEENAALGQIIPNSTTLKAELVHGIRKEMATSLSDLILRRTDLATGSSPGDDALGICAQIAARELKWSEQRAAEELRLVKKCNTRF